jgi:hypothetical protein
MMKKKLIYALSLCGMMLTASSCSNFLDQESSDEVIVTTVADYSELLLGSGYPSPTSPMYNLLYVLDDDFSLQESQLSDELDESAVGVFPFYTWQPDMWTNASSATATYTDCYAGTYTYIKGVNAVLDGIDEAVGDDEERDQVKAEALALRGYYYYMLVNIFSEPYSYNKESAGVPLKLTANLETDGRPRGTVAEVYNQIISDLTESAALFAKYTKRRGTYRINRPTVEILLCRVYLQMEEWQKVVDAATEAIKEGGDLCDYRQYSSSACISNYNYSEVEWVYGNGNTPSRSLSRMGPSSDFAKLLTSNDTRTSFWFYYSSWYGTWNVYKHRISYPSGTSRMPTNSIRMSEAWLSRAEAYAQLGQTASAQADLKELQTKRYTDLDAQESATASLTLLEKIRQERRVELCFDEVRWFDLRRYGMPSIQHTYKNMSGATLQTYVLQEKDPLYTIPIPADDVAQNGNIQQNASASQPARTPSN